MRPFSLLTQRTAPFSNFLSDLATVGVTPVAEGGQPYAVIAARTNQRWWLLPLDNRRAAAMGLEMIQPVTRLAETAKTAARLMARFGAHHLLGKGQMRLSGMPEFGDAFGSAAVQVAYFTGTDGPHRKTSMQVMDANGSILGYAKLSREAHIRPYIRNEAAMLKRVAALNLESADVPQLLALNDAADLTFLVTNSHKSSDVTTPLGIEAVHLRWLNDLRMRTSYMGAAPLLSLLANRLPIVETLGGKGWASRISKALSALYPVATEISLCLTHGDFTPWNSFVKAGQLYVFDWEYAEPAWPVGYDFVHFLLATIPPEQQLAELPRLLDRLASAQFEGHKESARRALLLSLVCHSVFYLGRLTEVQGGLKDWPNGPTRAALIDGLLHGGEGDA